MELGLKSMKLLCSISVAKAPMSLTFGTYPFIIIHLHSEGKAEVNGQTPNTLATQLDRSTVVVSVD